MVGKRNDDFTLNIDLAPTILNAAHIPIPDVMQGRDMSRLYRTTDPAEAAKLKWRQEFYYEWWAAFPCHFLQFKALALIVIKYWCLIEPLLHRFTGDKYALPASLALVRKDAKYILWPDFDYEQLFRLDSDPFEEEDLFKSTLKTNKDLFDRMKARFAELKPLAAAGVPL
jgi:arylsulfatase